MEEKTPELNLRRYWALIVKRRYLALSVALAVLSLFTWGSFLWPKTYEASSTVFVERSSLIDSTKGAGVSDSMEERLRVLKNSLTSRNIIDRVLKKLDLDAKAKSDAQYEGLIDGTVKDLDVKVKTSKDKWSADLFEITYTGHDPKTVRDLVNTLVSEFIEENTGYKRSQASDAYEFVQGQLAEYKKKLEGSDRDIRAFKEKNPDVDTLSESSVAMKADAIESAKSDADIRLKELMKRRDNIKKQLSDGNLGNGPQARLNALNNQLMVLSGKYTDDYPEVRKIKAEIDELKKQISAGGAKNTPETEAGATDPVSQQLRQTLMDTETEIEATKVKSAELSRRQRETRGLMGRIPRAQEEWVKLQRDRNISQKIYDDLTLRLESAGASKELELTNKAGNFRVVDPAVLPYLPAKPNTVLMIIAGIFAGIAAGIGAVIALDHFSNSFKDEGSVEARFNLPVLATIQTVTTEADKASARKSDRKVFAAAGVYFLLIILVLVNEFLFRYLNIKTFNF